MQKFEILKAIAAPLPIINIDTDMIIPKQFLKTIKRTGLGVNLFDEMRYTQDGVEIADFILNKSDYRNAGILVAGDNFGCGSSREHAPWALLDFGIKAIIAPSFADIFYNNCFKNGILPITLPKEVVDELLLQTSIQKVEIEVNLPEQYVLAGNKKYHFDVDDFRKQCLLNGWDDIGLTLIKKQQIDQFEQNQQQIANWLYN